MKIGLDFDGIISNCGKLKSDGAKKLYDVDIPPVKFKKEIVVGEKHLTMEQYHELQKIIYGTREIGFLMEPVDGVLHFLPRLVADGHIVLVVTSRGEIELGIAKEWSIQKGLQLDFIGVGHGKSKANAANGLDFYVDDDLDKLEPLVDIVPHRFLFSWGYNAHVDVGAIAKRVASWEELYRTIQLLGGVR
ncbi:MAG: hypothetical protein A2831_00160 [Candidatus Yanofskybacteria bacterium RIFCSPHIGHO2_01_FULL_44_17]|uniref:Nucleotidase n=1 Tax=Candidatus Yanofskybacteria bacterium RIFCSPHIGHO2_01_FULL_44_17 TaxID=1802668 RepID=A0A1F8ETX9_9BACT|nr:MAG: hypothetical protein A2831_00160 [Candidatus Yanofskybacteria bacterium RIFCSPHIGHO2_01_FULL_44_17]